MVARWRGSDRLSLASSRQPRRAGCSVGSRAGAILTATDPEPSVIDELHIAGLGVIEDVRLVLAPGLTVITGETGAGKTMVVTALQLLLGERADTSLVRAGQATALVEARLSPAPPYAVEAGWTAHEELIVARELVAGGEDGGGRSRARIGGRLAPVSALADVLGRWVEVHAQGAHARLARPEVQRALLDRYAGEPHGRTLATYRTTHDAWRAAETRLRDLDADARGRAREADRLRHELREIDAAAIQPEADARLDDELARLEHAEQLAVAAAAAAAALDEDGAGGPVGAAVGSLRPVAGHDPQLGTLLARAEGLAAEVADLRAELRHYAEHVEADQARLEQLRTRRRALGDLLRKYGADLAAVLTYAQEAGRRLEALESETTAREALEAEVARLAEGTVRLAAAVHDGRSHAAQRLVAAVTTHLRDLGMSHADFDVRLELQEGPGRHGADRVVFELAANPGEPALPLGSSASGGERARVALAIEAALADADEARVLVFDEVDAGVGGATAVAVGQKLADLAAGGRQVLCVTHLAQLAAFADVHHVVEKSVRDGRTVTTTRRVQDGDRPAELARMLSGSRDRRTGLAHARDLLADAAQHRAARPAGGGATDQAEVTRVAKR